MQKGTENQAAGYIAATVIFNFFNIFILQKFLVIFKKNTGPGRLASSGDYPNTASAVIIGSRNFPLRVGPSLQEDRG